MAVIMAITVAMASATTAVMTCLPKGTSWTLKHLLKVHSVPNNPNGVQQYWNKPLLLLPRMLLHRLDVQGKAGKNEFSRRCKCGRRFCPWKNLGILRLTRVREHSLPKSKLRPQSRNCSQHIVCMRVA